MITRCDPLDRFPQKTLYLLAALLPPQHTGENDADYKPPFALTAKLNKLTVKVDRPKLTPEDIKKRREAMAQTQAQTQDNK